MEEYKSKKSLAEQFAEARKIPKGEREDFAIGFSKNIAGSFIGRVNVGASKYLILNEENKDIEYAKTVDFGIGFGIPGVSASGSIILLKDVNTSEELKGNSFVLGGSIPFVGGEIILNSQKEFAGMRITKGFNPLENKIGTFPVDAYGSVDSTILRSSFNITTEKEILESTIKMKLDKLSNLTDSSKNTVENIYEITKVANDLKKDIERIEFLWKYKPKITP